MVLRLLPSRARSTRKGKETEQNGAEQLLSLLNMDLKAFNPLDTTRRRACLHRPYDCAIKTEPTERSNHSFRQMVCQQICHGAEHDNETPKVFQLPQQASLGGKRESA